MFPEVQYGLFVPARRLFAPKRSKKRWPFPAEKLSSGHLGMAGQAKGNHQLRVTVARLAMMYSNGPLSTLESRAARHGTAVAVTRENFFSVTAEVFLILPFQGITGRTEAQGENSIVPAGTTNRPLNDSRHMSSSPTEQAGQ